MTLLVTPEQANILAELEAEGEIHVALVYRGTSSELFSDCVLELSSGSIIILSIPELPSGTLSSEFSSGFELPPDRQDNQVLAVWGSPSSGKTIMSVKLARYIASQKKNVISIPELPSGTLSSEFSSVFVFSAISLCEGFCGR